MSIRQRIQNNFSKRLKTTGENIKKSITASKAYKTVLRSLRFIKSHLLLVTACVTLAMAVPNIIWVIESVAYSIDSSPHFYCNEVTRKRYPLAFNEYCQDYTTSIAEGAYFGPIDGVAIGHAISPEPDSLHDVDGKPGDQTGGEVAITAFSPGKWQKVIRPKKETHAEAIAACMEKICANNNIGYGWGGLNGMGQLSAYQHCDKRTLDPMSVKVPTNTNCAKAVYWCLEYAGIFSVGQYPDQMYTGNQISIMEGSGAFDVLNIEDVSELKRGDVLFFRVGDAGHTAVVVQGADSTEEQKE